MKKHGYDRDYYLANRERLLATQHRWYERNKERVKEQRKVLLSQQYQPKVGPPPLNKAGLPDMRWGRTIGVHRRDKKEYMAVYDRLPERKARGKAIRDAKGTHPRPGWTRDLKRQKLMEQDSRCAICGCEFTKDCVPCQDHNEATKTSRGLLCTNCNHLLGKAKDSIPTLHSAIAYLEKYAVT